MTLLKSVPYEDQLSFLAENDGLKRLNTVLGFAKEAIKAYGNVDKNDFDLQQQMVPYVNNRQPNKALNKRKLNELEQIENDLKECGLPEGTVMEAVLDDYHRLKNMPSGSQDYQVLYGYLKLVTALPWKKSTEDSCDLAKSK